MGKDNYLSLRSSPSSRISRTKSRYWYSSCRGSPAGAGAAGAGSFCVTVILKSSFVLVIGNGRPSVLGVVCSVSAISRQVVKATTD